MRILLSIAFVFGMVKYTHTQFLTIGTNRKLSRSTTPCDPALKSSLVEHFFNIIFTEFHSTPPVCVCVQMCPDQPTYCYPNGCLKKVEKNKKVDVSLPVARVSDTTKPIFFIDEKNDFMNDFLTKNYIDDNNIIVAPLSGKTEKPTVNMRPDPFKDRYKILFKYKKMPKVELKYNLGEQVKNMKSEMLKNENADVSKTRWPANKIDRRLGGGRRSVQPQSQVPKTTPNPKYFMSMFTDKDTSYLPKYSKRELSNNTKDENEDVDIKAIYVVGKSESDGSVFSLEKLIDSLIESSFDKNANSSEDGAQTPPFNQTIIEVVEVNNATKENSTKRSMKNENTDIISMNSTNENVDKNKYLDYNHTNDVGDMIATLSKRIEIQNNTSLEVMKRLTGDFEFDSPNVTTEKSVETTTYTSSETPSIEYTTSLSIASATKTTRKMRQRIVRRPQNGKHNV